MPVLIENIVSQLNAIQREKVWVGQNFETSLSSLSEEQAFTKIHGLHSVAEVISHLTAWRNETILKVKSGAGRLTEDAEENWLPNDRLKEIGWKKIQADYETSLTDLTRILLEKDDDFLKQKYFDPDFKGYFDFSFVIQGMLHHDIYHLGQLGIIIKFLNLGNTGDQPLG